jgi:ubiquinone/menaquinone biosynthesis C-methylase UbiE
VRHPPLEGKKKETIMTATRSADEDQAALWNGAAGLAWVETQDLLDGVLEPFATLLAEAAVAGGARRLLDVGCGTGGTARAVARALGADGQVIGVDISAPMIDAARARAERERLAGVGFICANAETHVFDPASFDMIISRFGVMFFDDSVRAFANLRRAARDGAELGLIAWRGPEENPFMTTAERAAAPLLPNVPPRRPGAPGQFAFADGAHVRRILEESGWAEIDIRPIDVVCTFAEEHLVRYFTRLGPLGRILQEADEPTRKRVLEAVRPAFDTYVHGDEVRFDAACWMIGARK